MRGPQRRDLFGDKRERYALFLVPSEIERVRRYVDMMRGQDLLVAYEMRGTYITLDGDGCLVVNTPKGLEGRFVTEQLLHVRRHKTEIIAALEAEADLTGSQVAAVQCARLAGYLKRKLGSVRAGGPPVGTRLA